MGNNTFWRALLDPNTFSDDGTIALTDMQSFSQDGEMFAYGTSVSGSDWQTVHFMHVSTGEILDDILTKVKFTNIVWKGNEGVFYGVSASNKNLSGTGCQNAAIRLIPALSRL